MCRYFQIMCRHLHFQIAHCLHVSTLQPDVSTLQFQITDCPHVSTLQPDVSTLHFQIHVYCLHVLTHPDHVSTLLAQKVHLFQTSPILLHQIC